MSDLPLSGDLTADPLSHGLWARTAPAAPETPALRGGARAQVAIIGAGYTGLSAALHLAEAGIEACVLDAAAPGFGGSGRNVGLVNAGMWVMPEDLPKTLGEVHGARLLETLGNAPSLVFDLIARHGIACEGVRAGTLHLAADAAGLKELHERARQWQARGAPVEMLDAAAARARVGGGAYLGALLDRRAGTIQPLAYARGLAGAALAAGARVHGGSPVDGVSRDGGEWVLTTPEGILRAPWLLVCAQAYVERIFPALRETQAHLPYFNMATPPLPAELAAQILPGREGCWDTKEILTSFRMDAAGRLAMGAVGRLGTLDRPAHRAWALRAMHRIFPQLKGVGFEAEWHGKIGMTDSHLPGLHALGEQAVTVTGYNGRGIAPGTVFGRLLAEHVLGRLPLADFPLPVAEPLPARRRRPREALYVAGSAAAHFLRDR